MNEQEKLDATRDSDKTLTDLEPNGEVNGGTRPASDAFLITFDRPIDVV